MNNPPPINTPLYDPMGVIRSSPWLLWLQKIGASIPQFYADDISVDLAAGGATHSISSIGFQPSACICLAVMDGGGVPVSLGFAQYDDVHGLEELCGYSTHASIANTWAGSDYLGTMVQSAVDIGYWHHWTPGPDIMTVTYDKIGNPVGTAILKFLMFK